MEAFERFDPATLVDALQNLQMLTKLACWIHLFFFGRTIRLSFNSWVIKPYFVSGTSQGCLISQVLFQVSIRHLLQTKESIYFLQL